MTPNNNSTTEPRPINADTLAEGAGESPPCSRASDPLKTVRAAISTIEPVSLLELSERYFTLPVLDGEGKPRKQPQSEVIVLVLEHFKRWLDEIGLGARVLNGLPHLFGGTHWKSIDDQDCAGLLGELTERLGYQVVESRIFTFREKLLKQFYSELSGGIEEREPGRVLINLRNGTLEFVNGNETMREFRKADALTYQLPFDYAEDARCPMFEKYLVRVLPEPASRNVLAEYLGWLFLRDLKLEKVLVLFGDGHNGKSVFFDVVNALLGEQNVSNLGLSSLSKIENRHQLGLSLLNFGSEISDRCDADLFKKLASGEPVEARRLYKDVFTMRNYARLAFNANVLPRDTEHTTGFFRRFLIVPFTETISEAEKDPDLANKIIAAELPGVFNWAMFGLRRLREARKFSECHAANHALATYRKESDSVAMFLEDEGWHSDSDGKVGKDQLYSVYRGYCQSAGCHPLSKNNFGKRLLRQHQICDSKSGGCRFWHLVHSDQEE
ncbi:MAG: phage/plasmid primase, P4 family [Verrucomicrobia bacterium]|nr:phage/plasmid primase, P4 family [Verrucomicrobiota bacterium]